MGREKSEISTMIITIFIALYVKPTPRLYYYYIVHNRGEVGGVTDKSVKGRCLVAI